MTVQLQNTSALGMFRFGWRSRHGSAEHSIQWGDGMGNPLAFQGTAATEVRDPERFGFKRPVTVKNFKAFVQCFAEAFEEEHDDD
ncbi:MAG TPA: hypothetical protein VGH54_13395 [Mycobacterium sp.]|jgi:hypothetical protein|uniref:hypothetical protein n=1 Tax=Mycobacterium sp. TaxID=1785 RepID=UPI002F422597